MAFAFYNPLFLTTFFEFLLLNFEFLKTVIINAPAKDIWGALTIPGLMNQWMSETPLDIITTWKVGNPFIITGMHYKMRYENKGTVLAFEPYTTLAYTHLSSISRLPDELENYAILRFNLSQEEEHTTLTIHISSPPDEIIYKHLAFYWNVTMEKIKKLVEGE